MILLAKIAATVSGTAVLAAALTFSGGAVTVEVENRKDPKESVWLFLPAAPAVLALKFVPDEHLRHLPPQALRALPAGEIAAWELERIPDTVLVEVEDNGEHVRIEKRGSNLVVDVDSPEESVHVSVPLSTIARCLRTLRNAQPQ